MNNGIKYLTLSDADISALYEGRYRVDMAQNQYLILKNESGAVIDKFRFNGEKLETLKFKQLDSYRFGKIKPLNDEQFCLFDLLQNDEVTVKLITGIFGSGKNFCSLTWALHALEQQRGRYAKIVHIRNNIEVKDTNNIGALPNGANEKLLPFAMPIADLLGSQTELIRLLEDGKLELLHLGFARGRSFQESIIVVDEAENLTAEHAALLVSRVEKKSVILFLGDTMQTDKAVFEKNSGIERLSSRLFGNKLFGSVHLIKTERSTTSALACLLT